MKYAIYIKLTELGFKPYIIGFYKKSSDITFINKTTNLRIIHKSFNEIKINDYDILIVNSEQTWRPSKKKKIFMILDSYALLNHGIYLNLFMQLH